LQILYKIYDTINNQGYIYIYCILGIPYNVINYYLTVITDNQDLTIKCENLIDFISAKLSIYCIKIFKLFVINLWSDKNINEIFNFIIESTLHKNHKIMVAKLGNLL